MRLRLKIRQNGPLSICLFLALKGLSARAVHNELTVVLGADAIAYSTVTKGLRQRQFTSILVDPSEEPATIVIDQAILDAIEHYPLSSIRELARFTCIPALTVRRHLTQSLGFVVKHLCWATHSPTPTQKRSVPLSQLKSCASSGPCVFSVPSRSGVFWHCNLREGLSVAGENETLGLGGFRHFFDDISSPSASILNILGSCPEFRSLQFLVQICDRGNRRSPSVPEVAPLKYPPKNHACTSRTRFISVGLGQHGESRQTVRWPDQMHLKQKYTNGFCNGLIESGSISHEF
jgi:hypothetical protein